MSGAYNGDRRERAKDYVWLGIDIEKSVDKSIFKI